MPFFLAAGRIRQARPSSPAGQHPAAGEERAQSPLARQRETEARPRRRRGRAGPFTRIPGQGPKERNQERRGLGGRGARSQSWRLWTECVSGEAPPGFEALGPLQAPHAMTLLRSKNQEQPPCAALKTQGQRRGGGRDEPGRHRARFLWVGRAHARSPPARPPVRPTAQGFSVPGQLAAVSAGAELETSRRNGKRP